MRANPEPHNTFRLICTQRPVVLTNTNRPQLLSFAYLLEMQRWVLRANLEQLVVLVRQRLHLLRQLVVVLPEARQG